MALARDIDLARFVPRADIPPLYFERSYFLIPSGSIIAYRLLAKTMESTKKAGIATFVMRGKQYLVAIMAEDGILRAETMRFQDELRSPAEVGLPAPSRVDSAEVKRMRASIKRLTKTTFATKDLQDEYWQRLTALVAQKRKKHQDVFTPQPEVEAELEHTSNVIDLVAILKRSLGQSESAGQSPVKSAKKRATGRKKATKGAARTKPTHERTRRAS